MTNSIPMPDISPNFTIDDIHKIRIWNHERRKGMSKQEVMDDIKSGAREFEALIEAARRSQHGSTPVPPVAGRKHRPWSQGK
jgi:hypothetical protein